MSFQPAPEMFATAQPLEGPPLTYAPRARAGREAEGLVRQHLPMVRRIAWHVHGAMSTLVDVEDLIQVGLVALVEAAAGASEEKGAVALRQYLATRVRGAMIDELRRQATTTRGAMRRRREHARAVADLTNETGRAPAEAAVATRLGVSVEKLRADYATAEAVRFEPIDDVYADDLPWFASEEPDAFDRLADGELRSALIAAIKALPEREALVIQLYHVEELNLEEIGQVIGVGAARVCQIKSAAHARLKKALLGKR